MTWEHLIALEPRLAGLLKEIESIKGGPDFDADVIWYCDKSPTPALIRQVEQMPGDSEEPLKVWDFADLVDKPLERPCFEPDNPMRGFKHRMCGLVGFYAQRSDPELRTMQAYNAAYDKLTSAIAERRTIYFLRGTTANGLSTPSRKVRSRSGRAKTSSMTSCCDLRRLT